MQNIQFSSFSVSVPGKKPTGRRSENQDRVLCRTLDVNGSQGVLLVVADGITKCPFGGSVARWIVDQHLTKDAVAFADRQDPAVNLRSYLEQLHEQFHTEFSANGPEGFLDSGATLSVGLLHHGQAECFWAGDSPIYISRKTVAGYDTELISKPDHDTRGQLTNCFGAGSAFNLRYRRLELASRDIITIASDGVTTDEYGLSQLYQANPLKTALDQLIRHSSRGQFWDDLSIAAGQAKPTPDGTPQRIIIEHR